ncbi:30S ribosomal protein S9 [Candidatus Shapirobacteria bacterium CG10_big_fil_rev_8_21_14_0_10_40_9]|uniref:30S ribosomal protein S9 n=1 Tax=Candidatus Shapirobacteria bacterium CG10_big_fil_rev_8_21_14_0_10_40_9 TaxID=1974888 RepID=A0A2M8L3L5_9BACT|nr:MAG: 30S ribosomal protein S9 [Candidatus Shapirobacteria bacterium CG10_big_fil_rev_8_21_14_0_10_40_9]
MPRTKEVEKPEIIHAVGRRKESIARIRLYKGKEETLVNNLPIGEYFPGEVFQVVYSLPFKLTDTIGKYYATIKVSGGGKNGQLGAVVHGLSRALALLDKENFRPVLKKAKLLTRDSRTRERRKVGMGGKARRKKQSPKR